MFLLPGSLMELLSEEEPSVEWKKDFKVGDISMYISI